MSNLTNLLRAAVLIGSVAAFAQGCAVQNGEPTDGATGATEQAARCTNCGGSSSGGSSSSSGSSSGGTTETIYCNLYAPVTFTATTTIPAFSSCTAYEDAAGTGLNFWVCPAGTTAPAPAGLCGSYGGTKTATYFAQDARCTPYLSVPSGDVVIGVVVAGSCNLCPTGSNCEGSGGGGCGSVCGEYTSPAAPVKISVH